MQITRLMTSNGINFTKAKARNDGIHIQPATTVDHRKLTLLLDERGTQYHTYLLPDEKSLKLNSNSQTASWRCILRWKRTYVNNDYRSSPQGECNVKANDCH